MDGPPKFSGDTGIYYDDSSLYPMGGVWVLNCSMTVWDVEYTWINGGVRSFNTTLASEDLSALLSSPLARSPLAYGTQSFINSAASIAAYTGDD